MCITFGSADQVKKNFQSYWSKNPHLHTKGQGFKAEHGGLTYFYSRFTSSLYYFFWGCFSVWFPTRASVFASGIRRVLLLNWISVLKPMKLGVELCSQGTRLSLCCQIDMFILLAGEKKLNLYYKTIIWKAICDFCCLLILSGCDWFIHWKVYIKGLFFHKFVAHYKQFQHV